MLRVGLPCRHTTIPKSCANDWAMYCRTSLATTALLVHHSLVTDLHATFRLRTSSNAGDRPGLVRSRPCTHTGPQTLRESDEADHDQAGARATGCIQQDGRDAAQNGLH